MVFIAAEYRPNMTWPLWFPVEYGIYGLTINLKSDAAGTYPRMTIYDQYGKTLV